MGCPPGLVDRYGRHTGIELIRKTHLETANPEITHDALRRWFSHDEECEATLRILGDQIVR